MSDSPVIRTRELGVRVIFLASIAHMKTIQLYDLAHARTGDKGNHSNISLIAYDPAHFQMLVDQVTEDVVAKHFAYRNPSGVIRYVLPQLHAMNFVLYDVLDGGVNDSLNLDMHGKTLSFHLLKLSVTIA